MTIATAPNLADLVARLQQQEAAVGVARRALNENTERTLAALHDTAEKLDLAISVLTSAPREIEAEQAELADVEASKASVRTKEAELEQQIAEAQDGRRFPSGRERDSEYDRRRGTVRSSFHRSRRHSAPIRARLSRLAHDDGVDPGANYKTATSAQEAPSDAVAGGVATRTGEPTDSQQSVT